MDGRVRRLLEGAGTRKLLGKLRDVGGDRGAICHDPEDVLGDDIGQEPGNLFPEVRDGGGVPGFHVVHLERVCLLHLKDCFFLS